MRMLRFCRYLKHILQFAVFGTALVFLSGSKWTVCIVICNGFITHTVALTDINNHAITVHQAHLQRQTAVTAYFPSKQLLVFVFACLQGGPHILIRHCRLPVSYNAGSHRGPTLDSHTPQTCVI